MKKLFTLVLSLAFLSAYAQVTVSPTGMMDEIGMEAENMSPNTHFVAGMNQLTMQPAIWNVQTGDIKEFAHRDTIYYDDDYWVVDYPTDNFTPDDYMGSFHAVTDAGLAVGEFGSGYGDKFAVKANVADNEVTYLYADFENEVGGSAYAVNADGSVILGFYYDASWMVRACIWVNGGLNAADRIDLPAPTEEEFGGPIDYVAARWMSADASVILGYAQDSHKGSWVMIYWTREANGSYTVHADHAHQYFTTYQWVEELDANGNPVLDEWGWPNMVPQYVNDNPYVGFEPNAISANGEWVSLSLTERYDPTDYEAIFPLLAARLNLKTNELQVLPTNGVDDAPLFYAIANNGTAVGATAINAIGPMAPGKKNVKAPQQGRADAEGRVGYVWPAAQLNIYTLQELYPNEAYFNPELGEFSISGISADATTIVGYTNQTDGVDSWVVSSFVAVLPELPTAIDNTRVDLDVKKVFENGQVVIIRDGQRYSVTGVRL